MPLHAAHAATPCSSALRLRISRQPRVRLVAARRLLVTLALLPLPTINFPTAEHLHLVDADHVASFLDVDGLWAPVAPSDLTPDHLHHLGLGPRLLVLLGAATLIELGDDDGL